MRSPPGLDGVRVRRGVFVSLLLAGALVRATVGHADPDASADAGSARLDASAPSDASLRPDTAASSDAPADATVSPDASTRADDVPPALALATDATPTEDTPAALAPSALTAPPAAPARRALPPVDTEVASYTLRARLDPVAHTVDADGTLTWRNTSAVPATDLWLHLYLNAFQSDDTLFARTGHGVRAAGPSQRRGGIQLRSFTMAGAAGDLLATSAYDPSLPDDHTQLRLVLPRPVAPGEAVQFTMAWRATLPTLIARTGAVDRFHMVAQWFPKVAVREPDGRWARFAFHANAEFYADFGRYDVTLTVPRGYTVGATGQRVEPVTATPEGDRHRYVQDRVHDFAWVAWDRFRTRAAAVGDVTLRVLHGPGDDGVAARVVDVLRDAMPRFARRYGPYPYATLTVLVPPREAEEAGGMEYPTFITTDGVWWHPRRMRYAEYVTVHEFGHQYFYGLLASNEHDHPFLDEGLCEYATARVMEDLYGPGGPITDLPLLGPRIDTWAEEAAHSGSIAFPMPVSSGAHVFPTGGRYGAHVYARTATALRSVERTYGAARFAAAMRDYAETWRFRHPQPDDLLGVLHDHLGDEAVTGFLRPALTEPAGVDLAVTTAETRREGGRWTGRAVLDRVGGPALPVTVRLEAADGTHTDHRWDAQTQPQLVLSYAGTQPLARVRVDPAGQFPFDRNRLNNDRRATGGTAPDTSDLSPAVARVQWWIANLLRLVGP